MSTAMPSSPATSRSSSPTINCIVPPSSPPASSHPPFSAIPALESSPATVSSTSASTPITVNSSSKITVPLRGQTSEYMLEGLPLPSCLEPAYAAKIACAYAVETRNILDAEAFIAERRYRQYLMAAQTVRVHMVRARAKRQEAYKEAARFRTVTDSVIANTSTSEVHHMQHDPNSDEFLHLLDESDSSDLRRFRDISNSPERGSLACDGCRDSDTFA